MHRTQRLGVAPGRRGNGFPRAITALALVVVPAAARAQGDESGDTAAARNLAVEGVKLAQSGRCADAVDKLERAEKLHHSAIVLGKLGECYVQAGRLVEGTEMLRRMLREPLPTPPSPALTKAYEQARSALDAAIPKVAGVTLTVNAPKDAEVTTTLDGRTVANASVGVERPIDPGEHLVEATAPGYLKAEKKITAGPGEKLQVTLELEKDPNWKPEPPPAAEQSVPTPVPVAQDYGADMHDPAPAEPRKPDRTAAYIAWGVGAAGLAVGGGFGVVAWTGKNKLDDECAGGVCPPDQSDRLDSAKLAGTISTIGFGVAGAGAILGTVLFFTAGSGTSERPPGAAHLDRKPVAFRARPFVGLGSAGLRGEF